MLLRRHANYTTGLGVVLRLLCAAQHSARGTQLKQTRLRLATTNHPSSVRPDSSHKYAGGELLIQQQLTERRTCWRNAEITWPLAADGFSITQATLHSDRTMMTNGQVLQSGGLARTALSNPGEVISAGPTNFKVFSPVVMILTLHKKHWPNHAQCRLANTSVHTLGKSQPCAYRQACCERRQTTFYDSVSVYGIINYRVLTDDYVSACCTSRYTLLPASVLGMR